MYFDGINFFMGSTKCIIADDSRADADLLTHYVKNEPSLDLIHTFSNGIEALSLIKEQKPPLLFLDIDMPMLNGIELFKRIGYSPVCIFVTAHSEYALESYEAHAFDFILKPVTDRRFSDSVQRLNDYLELKERADLYDTLFEKGSIVIKEGSTNHRVPLKDIIYIEALNDYSKVVTAKKKYITLSKLKHFMEKLPPEDFIRIHRSYAVAKSKIESYTRDEVKTFAAELPIGKTYRREMQVMLLDS